MQKVAWSRLQPNLTSTQAEPPTHSNWPPRAILYGFLLTWPSYVPPSVFFFSSIFRQRFSFWRDWWKSFDLIFNLDLFMAVENPPRGSRSNRPRFLHPESVVSLLIGPKSEEWGENLSFVRSSQACSHWWYFTSNKFINVYKQKHPFGCAGLGLDSREVFQKGGKKSS